MTAFRTNSTATDGSVALPQGSAADVLLGRWAPLSARLRELAPGELGVTWGRCALATLVLGVIAVVAFSTAGDSILVPRSGAAFPNWEAGPLHWLFGNPSLPDATMTLAYSALLLLMGAAYVVALRAGRALSLRVIVIAIVAINLILLMGPPLQLNDVFNYLGYARLGGLHNLNPYTHVINAESFDPVYRFATWRNLSSPYGPLFTALTYPLAWMSLPVAYWVLKVTTVGLGLVFLWCIYKCARLLGRDPRPALLLVAANPIYIFYEVGAFHNDFFMLVPALGAVALLLARRDRSAGAVLMLAVAVKFTAVILLPFLLIGARPPERRLRVITGAVLGAIPMFVLSVSLFGFSLPNLATQSQVVTGLSVLNLSGLLFGLGGATQMLMRVASVVVVLVVLYGLRRRDWIAGAGWGTVALIASLAWLMPWYIVWALPLAALAQSRALRRTVLAFSAFLLITFLPETGTFLSQHGINAMATPTGQAASTIQQHLQQ